MKKILFVGLLALAPSVAFSQSINNVGTCGWGSKLFHGQKGIAPQVFAATTNGSTGNQTFAISSGTSGCTQDGVVQSGWKTAMFIDSNMEKLAKDMSSGKGETLESLASLMEIEGAKKDVFFATTKENFAKIFSTENITSKEVFANLKDVMGKNAELSKYVA